MKSIRPELLLVLTLNREFVLGHELMDFAFR